MRFELTTFCLEGYGSTIELLPHMVPPPRIELGIKVYKTLVIPFNYRGIKVLAHPPGLEPGTTELRRLVLYPAELRVHLTNLVVLLGLVGGECRIRTHGAFTDSRD